MRPERFLWLDVETTGLSPWYDLLLEVAWLPSRSADPLDLDFTELRSVVVHHPGQVMGQRLSAFTWRMHGKSDLLADVAESKVRLADVAPMILQSMEALGPPDAAWYLAGNSVHFDRAFLDRHAPEISPHLSHRILDVTSLLLAARSSDRVIPKLEPAHRAGPDVLQSVELYRAALAALNGDTK